MAKKTTCTVCDSHKPLKFISITHGTYEHCGQVTSRMYGLTSDGTLYSFHPVKNGWVKVPMHEVK